MTDKEDHAMAYQQDGLVRALIDKAEHLEDALKTAISECVKIEAENKNLKRVIRNVRMQVNCDDT